MEMDIVYSAGVEGSENLVSWWVNEEQVSRGKEISQMTGVTGKWALLQGRREGRGLE